MEENNLESFDEDDDISLEKEMLIVTKLLDTMMVFNSHFAKYIREVDEDLFKRAIDYAKTFTEEDIPGIILSYTKDNEDSDDKENSGS
jgi:hypothetical protein